MTSHKRSLVDSLILFTTLVGVAACGPSDQRPSDQRLSGQEQPQESLSQGLLVALTASPCRNRPDWGR